MNGSTLPLNYLAFYDAENVYMVRASSQEEAERLATEEFGDGWQYVEPGEPT
ncbi:MAG TPA: hypothetical protein VN085_05520 [Vicinamibacterales bacterium]|nr:hypothetical protein [Vicinamibacterales bacterium]